MLGKQFIVLLLASCVTFKRWRIYSTCWILLRSCWIVTYHRKSQNDTLSFSSMLLMIGSWLGFGSSTFMPSATIHTREVAVIISSINSQSYDRFKNPSETRTLRNLRSLGGHIFGQNFSSHREFRRKIIKLKITGSNIYFTKYTSVQFLYV